MSFNSSMVRFGDLVAPNVVIEVSEFQFQYGAIWSSGFQNSLGSLYRVSIPVWCDLEVFALNS